MAVPPIFSARMCSLALPLWVQNHDNGSSNVDHITSHMNNKQKHLQTSKGFEQRSGETITQIQTAAKMKTALGIFV